MGKRKCTGCGIEINSKSEDLAGFVPEKVLIENSNVVCKRCFRIKNYGENIKITMSEDEYISEVEKVLKTCDVILFAIDIIDFESSMDNRILKLLKNKKIILVINKIDLIPTQKHPSEVAFWVKMRMEEKGLNVLDIAITSVKQQYGINGIIRKLKHFFPEGCNAGVIGVTNVGKSSLINSFFEGENYVTVSKYPGTTLKVIKHKLPNTNIRIIDTPGIIPEGRISDLVCDECNVKIIPSKEITRKTYKVDKNRVILIGGMVKITVLDNDSEYKSIFTIFASEGVSFHETNNEKSQEIIEERIGDLVSPPCPKCKDEFLNNKMKTTELAIEEGEEFVVKGLCWIAVKRGPLRIRVELPEKVQTVIREGIITPKRK